MRLPVVIPAALAIALAVGPLVGTRPAEAARRPHAAGFRPPVDAPVADPYRAPACTWCPGNRGLEYATAPGQPVVAAAAGRVTFAGTIAGVRWVTVEHPDGLRTSYGHLAEVDVRAGRTVAAGDVVGTAGDRTHFGVRRGDTYLDPAPLLAGGAPVPRLVPLSGGPSPWPRVS